ncbi:unnamed protein product [Calypogeia fissa]
MGTKQTVSNPSLNSFDQ